MLCPPFLLLTVFVLNMHFQKSNLISSFLGDQKRLKFIFDLCFILFSIYPKDGFHAILKQRGIEGPWRQQGCHTDSKRHTCFYHEYISHQVIYNSDLRGSSKLYCFEVLTRSLKISNNSHLISSNSNST